ncbi:MAG: hypothetical protein ABWY27_16295 [Telluria sp.]
MHSIQKVAVLFTFFASQLSYAVAAEISPAKDELTGHYYLSGKTEVGSELLLKESGVFEWVLMYGNADYSARGTWVQSEGQVLLTTAEAAPPVFRLFDESELNIRKPAQVGTWVAIVGVPKVGPVADVEVRFEASSGKTATAVSNRNGDAIVKMPGGEKWERSGLRRAGSTDEWQWLRLPQARAQTRIAAFAVNIESIPSAPFKALKLRREDVGLAVDDDRLGLRGVYRK